jgi:hypothetical protein
MEAHRYSCLATRPQIEHVRDDTTRNASGIMEHDHALRMLVWRISERARNAKLGPFPPSSFGAPGFHRQSQPVRNHLHQFPASRELLSA